MKKIAIGLLFFAFVFSLRAQNLPIDFEVGGTGINWNWTTFEDYSNPPLEFVDNPDPSGINPSLFVAKFTALQLGKPWAGFESQHGAGIGSFSFDASNCIFRIMVYKNVISDVGLKFASSSNAAQPELKKPNTLINQWEEMEFNVCGLIGVYPQVVDQIIIFPDFDLSNRDQDNIVYIDNIGNNVPFNALEEGIEIGILYLDRNPSDDYLTIKGKQANEQILSVECVNYLGQCATSSELSEDRVNISSLVAGLYFVRIVTSQRTVVLNMMK